MSIAGYSISMPVRQVIETRAASGDSFALATRESERIRDSWQSIIDSQLIEWGVNPGIEDDGHVSPSRESVQFSCKLAMSMRDAALEPPSMVVSNGEGGIVFERSLGRDFESIEVKADGYAEVRAFRDSKLVFRSAIPLGS